MRVFRLALLLAALVSIAAAPAAHAGPRYKACGSLNKGDRTLKFKASNLTCKQARKILAAPTDSSARVKGHRAYRYTAAGCEGVVWTDRAFAYSQANDGELPAKAKTIRYVVTRGCNS